MFGVWSLPTMTSRRASTSAGRPLEWDHGY
jgi:hypothetical protein